MKINLTAQSCKQIFILESYKQKIQLGVFDVIAGPCMNCKVKIIDLISDFKVMKILM